MKMCETESTSLINVLCEKSKLIKVTFKAIVSDIEKKNYYSNPFILILWNTALTGGGYQSKDQHSHLVAAIGSSFHLQQDSQPRVFEQWGSALHRHAGNKSGGDVELCLSNSTIRVQLTKRPSHLIQWFQFLNWD